VVLAHANIVAGVVVGAALANNDGASQSRLTAKDFHAQSLGCGFATVFGTTYAFLVCHD
jgi:hypothetical protein